MGGEPLGPGEWREEQNKSPGNPGLELILNIQKITYGWVFSHDNFSNCQKIISK
jgi:hypothetical protein